MIPLLLVCLLRLLVIVALVCGAPSRVAAQAVEGQPTQALERDFEAEAGDAGTEAVGAEDAEAAPGSPVVPAVDAGSAGRGCCYVPVEIHVDGTDAENPARTRPVAAELYVNGRSVGKTPFVDGLPPSSYRFEVELEGKTLLNEVVVLEVGAPYVVRRTVALPPTAEQLAARAAARREEREARLTRAAAALEAYRTAKERWERETAGVRRRRSRMTRTAWVTGFVGGPVAVAGAFALGKARSAHQRAGELREQWETSTLAADRANLAAGIEAQQVRRDRLVRAGWPLLGVGVSSLVTSIVTAVKRPDVPPPPERDDFAQPTWDVAPSASLQELGLTLWGRF